MDDNLIFNLEKIKELTNPIEDLQVELNQLSENYLKISKNLQILEHEISNENFISQLAIIKDLTQNLNNKLNKISTTNL
ncbi:MAG: hypothetical protein ACFFDF_19445, partial [Candidatus Odinarchaeota archaeon]